MLPPASKVAMNCTDETIPQLTAHYVFRWEASQDAHVLLYPEGLIKLNQAAGEILKRCDGQRNVEQIIADLDAAFPGQAEAIALDTRAFLSAAKEKGWLRST